MTQKVWTKEEIKTTLQTNDAQLIKAFKTLIKYQTADELRDQETKYYNNVGFNGRDGKFAASLFSGLERYGRLTFNQMKSLRRMMLKYSGQLTKIVNGEITLGQI